MKRIMFLLFIFYFFTISSMFSIQNNNAVKEDLEKFLESKQIEKLIEDIKNRIEKNIAIIDVRPESTYKKGHIPTTINIPNGIIAENQSFLKDKDIVLYCETGGRVEYAKTNFTKNGFDKKRMLNFGGFSNYKGFVEK